MVKLRRTCLVLLLFTLATIVSIFSLHVIAAQNENLTVITDIDKVNVNEITPVTITVTCATSDTCNQGDPVKADISLNGAGFNYNVNTGNTGQVVVKVNPTSSGFITVTAKNGADIGTASIEAIGLLSKNPQLQISSDTSSVYVNNPTTVTFTVTETCPIGAKKCTEGSPVSGASIDLSGVAVGSGMTDNNGQLTISINANSVGSIIATATNKGYDPGTTSIKAGVQKGPQLDISANPNSVYMDIPTDVTFVVTSQGSPISNATIHVIGEGYGNTDNNGKAVVTVNPSSQGIITAKVSKTGFTNGSTTISIVTTGSSIPLSIATNNSGVYVGVPENVIYTVTRPCGTIPGEICAIANSPIPVADANITISGEASGSDTTNSNGKGLIIVNAGNPGIVTASVDKPGYTGATTDINATMAVNFAPGKNKYYRGETVNLILSNNGGVPIQLGSWSIKNDSVNSTGNIVHLASPIGTGSLNPNQSITLNWDQTNNSDANNTQCDSGPYKASATYSFNGVSYSLDAGFSLSGCTRIVNGIQSYSSSVGQDATFTGNVSSTSRKWNITTWYINSVEVYNQTGVKQESSYLNDSAVQGEWNVTAVAIDGCSSITWSWIWSVNKPSCLDVQNYRNISSQAGKETIFKTGNLSSVSNAWNFTWFVNGVQVFNETGPQSTYVNSGGSVGIWNVTAVAIQDCNKVNWTWTWNVTPKPPSSSGSSGGSSGGGGGGGGGSGGGGIVSAEPFSNILKFERQDADLVQENPVPYTFSTPEFSIYQVLITGRVNEGGIGMRIEHLKNTSALVSRLPAGTIYANENVWLESKRYKDVLLRFRVKNSWLADNNLVKENIQLLRFNDGWKRLPTNVTKSDDNFTYFEARGSGLSSFAVSGLQTQGNLGIPTDNTTNINDVSPVETPRVTASPTKKSPGFEILLGIGMISMIYILKRRIKKIKKE